MSRTPVACLVVVALAAALGVHFGGRIGVGLVGGALLGGAAALAAHRLLARSLTAEFDVALKALLGAIALKAVVLLLAAGALTLVPALVEVADAPTFLLTYVATALVLTGVGSLDHLRVLRALPGALAPRASATEPGESLQ